MMIPEEIREYLHFDPFSGAFLWLKGYAKRDLKGRLAGVGKNDRYSRVMFRKRNYLAHRLAYWFFYGELPDQLDHINGDTHDNRICNLRPTTSVQNALNRKCHRSGKLPYTCWNKRNRKWEARIHEGKNRIYLGLFKTEREASDFAIEQLKGKAG